MHKQLLLFHNAISAYFAGNQQQLEQTLKQFNIKLRPPGADKPSWLEEQWEDLLDLLQPPFQSPPPVTCWNPLFTEDHYRRKRIQIIGWMKIWEERVAGWLDRWIAGYYWWVSKNAAGNQVASFMNSLGALSASSWFPFFPPHSILLFVLCSQRNCSSLPSFLSPIWPNLLSHHYVAVWACVSRVHGHYCSPQVLPVLWVQLCTVLLTQTDEKRKKTLKHTPDVTNHYFQTTRPYQSPSVPPPVWANVLHEHVASREER